MPLKSLLNAAQVQPKKLFLIDGFGALLSAFLLGIILPQFTDFFGMPVTALYVLAAFPVLFLLCDLSCYLFIKGEWQPFLRMIAIANLGYCLISIGYLIKHYEALTIWGWWYFISELIIVILLALFELRIANKNIIIDEQ